MIKNKHGQLTMFLIIGILLLGGILIYVSNSKTSVDTLSIESKEDTLQKTPLDARPVMETALSCLETVSEESIIALGDHGGYVDSQDIASDGSKIPLQTNSFQPTAAEAVELFPGASVPFWHFYMGEGNCGSRCVIASKRPALSGDPTSIQTQLSNRISRNFNSCIEDAKIQLKEAGYEIAQEPAKTEVRIGDKDVLIKTVAPIHITRSGASYELKDYTTRVDVPLKTIYQYATDITEFQRSYSFFELGAISLISAHTGLDDGQLPPLGDTTAGRGKKRYWVKTQVREQVQDILTSYVPLFQVKPSLNYKEYHFGNAIGDSIAERFVMPLGSTFANPDHPTFKNYWNTMDVRFTYLPQWPLSFNIRGNGVNGELIAPKTWSTDFPLMSFFETNDYEYYYDAGFPILVTLKDPEALGGRGYTFQFAIEANLQNNQDPQYSLITANGKELSLSTDAGGALTCNLNQRTTAPMTIQTVDAKTKKPLDDVRILYRCGLSCPMGTTLDGELVSQFPKCIGGTLVGSAEGYASYPIPFTTMSGQSREVKMDMIPLKQLSFRVKKFTNSQIPVTSEQDLLHDPMTRHAYKLSSGARDLDPTDEVLITITPRENNKIYGMLPIMLKYTLKDVEDGTLLPFNIVPGEYEVTLMTQHKHPTKTLPRWSCEHFSVEMDCQDDGKAHFGDFGISDVGVGIVTGGLSIAGNSVTQDSCETLDECTYINAQDFGESFFKGQVAFNWTVTDAIYTANGVEFFTVTNPDDFKYIDEEGTSDLLIGDLALITETGSIANSIKDRLMPRYYK